jgi:hypothetical protein
MEDSSLENSILIESIWKNSSLGKNGLRETTFGNLLDWQEDDVNNRLIRLEGPLPISCDDAIKMLEYLRKKIPIVTYGTLEIFENLFNIYIGAPRENEWRCTEVLPYSLAEVRPDVVYKYFRMLLYSADMIVPSGEKMLSIETCIHNWYKAWGII